MVLDTMLSLAFLCWPLVSPNDFHRVDHPVWLLNWSPAAKAANTAGVVAAIALGAYAVGLAVAARRPRRQGVVRRPRPAPGRGAGPVSWLGATLLAVVDRRRLGAAARRQRRGVRRGRGRPVAPGSRPGPRRLPGRGPDPRQAAALRDRPPRWRPARALAGAPRGHERETARGAAGPSGSRRRSARAAPATRSCCSPRVLGLPPLAAVSLAAGASGHRRWEFAALCLLGRTARFGVLALPAAYALS